MVAMGRSGFEDVTMLENGTFFMNAMPVRAFVARTGSAVAALVRFTARESPPTRSHA